MKTNVIKIKCPICGYEYLPEEIFYSDKFLGSASNIIRDEQGKIIDFKNDSMNLHEEFICDKCGSKFNVDGKIVFDVTEKEKIEDEEFVVKI